MVVNLWDKYTYIMGKVNNIVLYAAKKKNTVNADPFAYIKNVDIGTDQGGVGILKNVTASGWNVVMVLAVVGFVISLMICGIRLSMIPKDMEDVKKQIMAKSLIFIGICGGTFLFSLFMTIAKSLFYGG